MLQLYNRKVNKMKIEAEELFVDAWSQLLDIGSWTSWQVDAF